MGSCDKINQFFGLNCRFAELRAATRRAEGQRQMRAETFRALKSDSGVSVRVEVQRESTNPFCSGRVCKVTASLEIPAASQGGGADRGIKVPLGRIDCGPGGLKGKRTGCSYGSLTSTQTVKQTCDINLDMGSNQYYL